MTEIILPPGVRDEPGVMATPDPATTDWVPLGPAGAMGAAGPAGAQGPAGPQGPPGSAASIPARLGPLTAGFPNNDLNQIDETGWYNGAAPANAPGGRGDWIFVMHIKHFGGTWSTQICWTMQTDPVREWQRSNLGGPWSAWRLVGGSIQSWNGWLAGNQQFTWWFSPPFAATPTVATGMDMANGFGNDFGPRTNGVNASYAVIWNVTGGDRWCHAIAHQP